MTRTVRGLLLLSATILSSCLFLLVFFSLAAGHEESIRRDAVDSARTLARVTFNSMFELMRTGWSRAQLDRFANAVGQAVADSPSRIQIYRGERVDRLFGPIDQPLADARLRRALETGADIEDHSGDAVRFIFPLRAESTCLRCHTNAAAGDVLGAIVVDQTVTATLSDNRERTFKALLPAVPIALLVTVGMVAFINRRVQVAIAGLSSDIAAVSRVADLDRLAARERDLGFAEFDVLADGVRQLTERLRRVAIDRNMLELELRLLEKFVITTEVVRDWHDYVLQLLRELNAVQPCRMLFSVFRVDGEYQVDVFWLGVPDERIRLPLEKGLRGALLKSYPGTAAEAPRIAHHAAEDEALGPIPAEAAKNRSLFVQEVKIGGIVGIGLAAPKDEDGGLALAIDGVLSTLLNVVGSVRAIHRYTSELEHYATRDPLTGLYNQRLFWELLENERVRCARLDLSFGLLLIDVDNFKRVNDRFGHGFGDGFVRAFAHTLRKTLRAEDVLARYGGDEFVAILPAADLAATVRAAERALDAVRAISLTAPDGTQVAATASIGMAVYPEHGTDGRDIFLFADQLMYRAKAEGRNRAAVPADGDAPNHYRSTGERNARVFDAVRKGRVEPFFQPIADVRSGEIVAFEALARLHLDDERPASASEFLPVAERLGLLQCVHQDVLRRAVAALAAADFHGRLLVNVSPWALVPEAFVREARALVDAHAVPPDRVVFEVSEREAAEHPAQLERLAEELHAAGFALAIDHFGSDLTALQALKRFSADLFKIDGKLIAGLLGDEKDRALVRHIVALARDLGAVCVAEGIESAAMLDSIAELGIELAQGYYVGRPAAALSLATATAPSPVPTAAPPHS